MFPEAYWQAMRQVVKPYASAPASRTLALRGTWRRKSAATNASQPRLRASGSRSSCAKSSAMDQRRSTGISMLLAFSVILGLAAEATAGSVSYEYDALGRLERIVYDDGKVIEFVYDAAGNRTSRVVTTGS